MARSKKQVKGQEATPVSTDYGTHSEIEVVREDPIENNKQIEEISTSSQGMKVSVSDLPKSVYFIVVTELCERYSYYGLRSILVLYFTEHLNFKESTAKAIYAYLMAFAYTMPLIGGALADSKLGKFKTIFYCGIIYIIGALVLSLWNKTVGAFVGMIFICIGTGGIKPNISSFGADQIDATNTGLRNTFFNMFYFSINVGSVVSTVVTPQLRSSVGFRYAFLVPSIMLCFALFIFAIGRKAYKELPPQGSVLIRVWNIIKSALRNRKQVSGESSNLLVDNQNGAVTASDAMEGNASSSPVQPINESFSAGANDEAKEAVVDEKNWLDAATVDFPQNEVNDVKQVWRLLPIFAFLPVFWTLFDQQGSTWSLQAKRLYRKVGGFTLQPAQIQVLNPLLIVILVPLAQGLVYPFLRRRGYPLNPLNRMICGMVLTALSFCAAGAVDVMIENKGFNKVSVFMQVPQYVLISTAEILVSTTGLEFAYSQAPESMKSTVTSVYLLTVALGDIIAGTIFASTNVAPKIISFVCAGLMLLNGFVFSLITSNYKFAPGTDPAEQLRQFNQSDAKENSSRAANEPLLVDASDSADGRNKN